MLDIRDKPLPVITKYPIYEQMEYAIAKCGNEEFHCKVENGKIIIPVTVPKGKKCSIQVRNVAYKRDPKFPHLSTKEVDWINRFEYRLEPRLVNT